MEKGNPEIKRTFERLGAFAKKNPDLRIWKVDADGYGHTDVPETGHPDYTVIYPPFAFWVEAKDAERNFEFSAISKEQREWLTLGPKELRGRYNWSKLCFLWLWMGKSLLDKEYRRRAWLVSWSHWLAIEEKFTTSDMAGMPFMLAQSISNRQKGLCAVTQLGPHELIWGSDRSWIIPKDNEFWKVVESLKH